MIQGPSVSGGLSKLRDLMDSLKKPSLSELFPPESLTPSAAGDGDQLVEKAAFLRVLKEQTLVGEEEAEGIAKMCAAAGDADSRVSLRRIEEQMKKE
jgi:hypothetical protein